MADDTEPRKPMIIFGNGLQGEVESFDEGIIDDEGLEVTRIEFRPTQELVDHYGYYNYTKPEELTFIVDYPKVYVRVLLAGDPKNRSILVMCDFFGRDTDLTRLNIELLNSNKLLQRQITSLKYQTARLNYDLQVASRNYGEYAKNQLDDVFVPIAKKMKPQMIETPPNMPGPGE